MRREHDLFHASHIESQVNLDDRLPLVAYLLRFAGGVWTRRVTQERVRSTQIEVAGYMQVIPRLFVCSAARQGTAVDIYSLAQGLLPTLVSLLLFLGRTPPRTSALQHRPQDQQPHDALTQWR